MTSLKNLKLLTSDLNVLYVEDDLSIQNAMNRYLTKLFSSVTTASNGGEGLAFFKESKFDIVITDLSMPIMDGIEMIKQIRELDELQPILITTAHGESSYLMDAIKVHIDGYILKPFDYDELNFILYKISEKLRKFKENEEYKHHLQKIIQVKTKEMNDNYEKSIYSMVELIEQRDTYTAGHSKRVADYSKAIAQEMGYSSAECKLIHQAGILHDIGKIETPDTVLLNPKQLNEIEYKLIQEHVSVGYKLLNSIPMFKPMATIVYSHHERHDGYGYPNGLAGDKINKLARIMIVADAFDAMTTNRIYKARKTVKEAIQELQDLSGKQFSPEVVKSAVVVLKETVIDESINQLPKTKLEEERFAYFYNDTLSEAYNQSYLDLILTKNSYEKSYSNMIILSISNFSSFNKKHGWEEGDKLLKEFANTLTSHFKNDLVFRVFGDDFVVLSKENIVLNAIEKVLDALMRRGTISYKVNNVDLNKEKIEKLIDIEMIQAK